MGNSPSSVKNDASQSAQSSSSSSTASGNGEVLEPDPRRPPPSFHKRAIPSPSTSTSSSGLTKSLNFNSTTTSTTATTSTSTSTSTATITKTTGTVSPKKGTSTIKSTITTTTVEKNPLATDLDLASSLAYALNINKFNNSSSSDDVCSSLGSDMSLITDSSISSVSSMSGTGSHNSSSGVAQNKSLDPIDELAHESSPEPRSAIKKSKFLAAPTSKPTVVPDDIGIDSIIESLIETGLSGSYSKKLPIKLSQIQYICSKSREIFLSQPMLLELAAPVKVVGDIHGQFNDLLRILKLSGFPPHSNYLFLGDYVDRGKQSLETLLLLLCFKIKYPENFFMLRGNHESASITKIYGFYDECKRRSSSKCWKSFVDVFNCLPVAATIGDKIFCVHGGLSPHLTSLNQITRLSRPTDVPDEGLLSDVLWSDPDPLVSGWSDNDRGVSFTFGADVVGRFLKQFNMDLIVRAHMVVEDGYEFFAKRRLVTVFSAPNYCGEFDNWGAVMNVSKNLVCSFEMLKPYDKNQLNGGGVAVTGSNSRTK